MTRFDDADADAQAMLAALERERLATYLRHPTGSPGAALQARLDAVDAEPPRALRVVAS